MGVWAAELWCVVVDIFQCYYDPRHVSVAIVTPASTTLGPRQVWKVLQICIYLLHSCYIFSKNDILSFFIYIKKEQMYTRHGDNMCFLVGVTVVKKDEKVCKAVHTFSLFDCCLGDPIYSQIPSANLDPLK